MFTLSVYTNECFLLVLLFSSHLLITPLRFEYIMSDIRKFQSLRLTLLLPDGRDSACIQAANLLTTMPQRLFIHTDADSLACIGIAWIGI